MAESFECPKCGAPLSYNAREQDYTETMACPYCGNSIIVPAQLRVRPPATPAAQVEVINLTSSSSESYAGRQTYRTGPTAVSEVGKGGGKTVVGCLVAIFLLMGIFGAGSVLFISQTTNNLLRSVKEEIPGLVEFPTPQPTATDLASSIQTQIAPLIAEVTDAVGQMEEQLLIETQTPEPTPTEEIDLTATAAADFEATRSAQTAILTEQRTWPVVLDEQFNNANRNWSTGPNNSNLSVEDLEISANQYVWQITSKKSMGSFSFPDMNDLTDMLVSVDLQMTNSTGNLSDQAGIIFRQNEGAFYFFGANPQGTFSLRLYDGSGWNQLIELSESDFLRSKQPVHLEVSMQGSQIILAINNEVVGWADDAWLNSGIAGLGVNLPAPGEDATVIFSNFKVQAP